MIRAIILILLLAPTFACRAEKAQSGITAVSSRSPESSNPSTQLVLLGTGTPNADPTRSGPALAVVVNGQAYLVDCGPGITHLHSDHTLGYPDLILTPWVLERNTPLEAYGPPGLAAMTEHILAAYQEDIAIRIDGAEPANTMGYQVNVHELTPGVVYQDKNIRVTAFPVRHGSWPHAYGFRFDTADRSIVVSGDTAPCESLVKHAKGCDLLVHEVYSHVAFQHRPAVWQRYHASFHTSTTELAEIARQVQPKLLVLTHQLFWGSTPAELVAEIRKTYAGDVRSGNDLDVY